MQSATLSPEAPPDPGNQAVRPATRLVRDDSSFEAVYHDLVGPVSGLVQRILRDPAHAEEVVQEVFLEVWRLAERYAPDRGRLRSWVLTIAHRRAVDRVRAERSAADRVGRAAALEERSSPVDGIVDLVIHLAECERLRSCLGQLTELQREAVRLVYSTGHTQREVAERLGVPLSTVKGRLRDGLLRLRACMGDRDGAVRRAPR